MSRARDVANRDIIDGSITNADINSGAAIAASKLSGVIPASLVTAKGDLIAATGSAAVARLGVGTNGQVLTADSTAASGVSWQAVPAGSLTVISTITANNTAATYTISSIPQTYKRLLLVGYNISCADTNTNSLWVRFNSDTTGVYPQANLVNATAGGNSANGVIDLSSQLAISTDVQARRTAVVMVIDNYTATSSASRPFVIDAYSAVMGTLRIGLVRGQYTGTNAITSLNLITSSGLNFQTGTFVLYGVN